MKKRFGLVLILCLVFAALVSCVGNNSEDSLNNITGDYIFKNGSEITVVTSMSELEKSSAEKYNELVLKLDSALVNGDANLSVLRAPDSAARVKHEIMFGRCDRELSRQAYRELDALEISGNDTKFLIYSNGSSVAIAYHEDDTYNTPEMALDYFIENYVSGKKSLTMRSGTVYSTVFSLTAFYQERDDAIVEQQWAELQERIEEEMRPSMSYDSVAYAEDIVSALREFYEMYNDELISWLANLLEPDICVCEGECLNTQYCGGAGFYYSNSARDTVGFLPDSESTAQAIGILVNTGMLSLVGDDPRYAFTEAQADGFIRFCKGLQDAESGYFYHPQWNKEELSVARRGRDMTYACSVLKSFGSAPTYDAPNGTEGDGITYDGIDLNASGEAAPASKLTGRLVKSVAAAVSSIVTKTATEAYPSYMENDITYKAYLATLDLKGESYSVGNQLAASATQLINRQKQLTAQGASYNLIDITVDWFKKNQNTKTGTWYFIESFEEKYDPYYGNDGVLKISAWFNDVGREFPNAALAAQNAINAIMCDVDINHVCNLYNTWFTISNLKNNVRKYGSAEVAEKFINDLRLVAADGIRKSRDKIADHQKADGSFSYYRDHCSQTSQGMPVALPDTNEGDLNATSIATYGIVGFIFSALDFGEHPYLYTDTDRREFLSIVTELEAVIKNGEIDPAVPHTFDNYTVGDEPDKEEFSTANSNPKSEDNPFGTSFEVITDERPDAYGNVLSYHSASKVDSTDYISLMATTGTGGNTWAFSIDLCLTEFENLVKGTHRKAADGDAIYINMGNGLSSGNIYMIALRVREENGKQIVGIWDVSSDSTNAAMYNHIADVAIGEWFNLKVEYYRQKTESSEGMRAKIYVNDNIVFVSDNYFDLQGAKLTGTSSPNTTFNRVWISTVDENLTTLLMDNFAVYKFRKNYTVEKLPIEKNVDGAGNAEKLYDFDELPSDIESDGSAAVENGVLLLSDGEIYVPANIRSIRYNRASFEADLTVSGNVGEAGYLQFVDNTYAREKIIKIGFRIVESSGKKYVQLYEMQDGVAGDDIDGARFEVGVSVKLRLDFFNKEDKTLVYIDGIFANQSDAKFGEVNKLTYGGAQLYANAGYTMVIDNLVADFDTCEFTEAPGVKINVSENLESFNTDAGDAVLEGGAELYVGMVKLGKKNASVKLAPSVRSYIGQCNILAADISLYDPAAEGDLVRLAMKDSDGNILFAVDVVADAEYICVYEYAAGGRYPLVIAKGAKNDDFTIRIEYYSDTDKANVYINELGVVTTNISYDENSSSLNYAYAEITSLSSNVTLTDNVTADFLYRPFVSVGIEDTANEENGKKLVTLDYALDTNIPSAVTGKFNTYGAGISIKQMLKKLGDTTKYSKIGEYTMSAGGNDELLFGSSSDKATLMASTSVVFEGEFCVDTSYSGTLWQVIFGDSSKGLVTDAAYMFAITANKNGIYLYESSSTNGSNSRTGSNKFLAKNGEWFKLRVVYYSGNDDTVRIKIYLNDELLLVSNNYYRDYNKAGSPKNYFNQINFYGQSKSYGTLYFDNISFYANNGATCDDAVTETYSYGSKALDEYKR